MYLLVSKAIYSHCCRRLLRSNYFLILRIRSACPIQCLQIYESALLPAQLLRPQLHPLYIKKKLFLDILANDFSSSRLLGSTGKPDRAANRWPQFACLSLCPDHVIIISWALESYGESDDCFVAAATNCASN